MDDWRLLHGGAWAGVRDALRLSRPNGRPRVLVAIAMGIGLWLVTLALAYADGGAGAVRRVLGDYGISVRLLLAIPILLVDEWRVDRHIAFILPSVIAGGFLAPADREHWEKQVEATRRRVTSGATLLVVAAIVVFLILSTFHPGARAASEWMRGSGPMGLSLAGLWYTVLARPVFLFLGLLWIWRWVSISLLIWRTSRAPLELQPTHPDRMGGMAIFMGLVTAVMALVFTASAVVSAEVYYEMSHGSVTLKSAAPILIAFVVMAVLAALGPLLLFAPRLTRLRRRALYLYGVLAAQHSAQFEKRWFNREAPKDDLMGAPEISSLTDLASAYFVGQSIRVIPFSRGTVVSVALAAALPMVPCVLLEIPLQEIISRIAKLLM